jgi:outer membrane receptor protein involved in Fe transport
MVRLKYSFLILSLVAPLSAQVTSSALSGFVLDPTRRPVPNVKVVVSNAARALSREAYSDSSGFYRFVDLEPAGYDVTVSADRFESQRAANVAIAVDSPARLDFHLLVAGMRQSVEVKTSVSAVQTESSDLGAVMAQARIEQLPLNERDFLQLAYLVPGVTTPVEGSQLSTRGEFAMHVNGAREEFNNYLLDGVDNNDQNVNRYVLEPPVDSIQEFKISTNSYSAEYGRNAGGQVNIITRGGSNELHGFAYEYLRNRDLDARNFFDPSQKAKYVRNQFGAGVGGPLRKDRLFFFTNFDSLRARQGLTQIGSVPTLALRSGDVSGLDVLNPFTGEPFPNNHIPVNPLAAKILALFPAPNLPGDAGNYLSQPVQPQNNTQFNARADYHLSPVDRFSLRYSYGRNDLTEPFAEDSTGVPGFGDFLRDTGHNAMVHYVRTLSPHSINSLTLGLNRATRLLLPAHHNLDVNKLWGVNYLPVNPLDFGYPGVTVAGYSHVGDVAQIPLGRASTTYQVGDTVSLIRGSHTIKLGGEFRHLQINSFLDLFSRGTMSFSGAISGSVISDLLLGYPTLDIQAQDHNPQAQRTSSYNAFVQDDWKVLPNLTLNLGVRYEFNSPVVDAHDGMAVFNPQTGSLDQVGTHGISRSGYSPDWNNIAPRIGLAWSPSPNFVVRAGYGIFYDAGITVVNSALYFNPPYFVLRVFFPSAEGLLTLDNPFALSNGVVPPPGLNTLSPNLTTAYMQNWNIDLQREWRSLGTLSVAYAGSKGTHMVRSLDLNQPAPGPGDLSDRAPYPQYSNIFFTESGADSTYHSLQVSLNRPMARGLSMLLSYTFSKSIDDTSAYLADPPDPNFPQNSHNYRAERGLSSFDTPQRLTLAFVYQLPGRSRWIRGTQLRGIVTAQSGQPFTPILQFDNSNTGNTGGTAGSDRPNVVGSPHLANPSPAEWFNTAAFAVPPPYTFGNAGRNILRGPGFFTTDVSLAREIYLRERMSLLLEGQVFNAENRVNFNLPELYADSPNTFGRIFSAKAPRQIQFAARLRF